MSAPIGCDTVRDIFFEMRQGRIEPAQQEAFEAHLTHCQACADYANKLDGMLDEALLWQPAQDFSTHKKGLFDRIVADIERPDDGEAKDHPGHGATDGEGKVQRLKNQSKSRQHSADGPGQGRSTGIYLAGLIAAVAAAVAVTLWVVDGPEDQTDAQGPLAQVDGAHLDQAGDRRDQAPAQAGQDEGAPTEFRLSESLRVFADDDARWHLDADGDQWEVVANKGRVIVEFIPGGDANSLQVGLADGIRGQVTGTVLYADAERREIGVITGGVDIDDGSGGEATSIADRQVWRDGQVEEIDDLQWRELEQVVDIAAHNQRLALSSAPSDRAESDESPAEEAAAPPADTDPETPTRPQATAQGVDAPEATDDGPVHLRIKAERALRERRFDAAADHYEQLLDLLPKTDRSAQTIRLDLARLYEHELQDRQRTVDHLEFFADTWPDDAVTPQVITQLCRLVDDPDERSRCRRR